MQGVILRGYFDSEERIKHKIRRKQGLRHDRCLTYKIHPINLALARKKVSWLYSHVRCFTCKSSSCSFLVPV